MFFEIVFFVVAGYIYLFSIGKLSVKDPEKQAKLESFRNENAGWLKLLSLAIMAIMAVNIFISVRDILMIS